MVQVLSFELGQIASQLIALRLNVISPKDLNKFFSEKLLPELDGVLPEHGAEYWLKAWQVLL